MAIVKSKNLISKYPNFKRIQDNINKKAKEQMQSIHAVFYVFKIFTKEQVITTLIDRILSEDPVVIMCHENMLAHFAMDPRFRNVKLPMTLHRGIFGMLGNAIVYCYSSTYLVNESRILLYKKNKLSPAMIRVLYGKK